MPTREKSDSTRVVIGAEAVEFHQRGLFLAKQRFFSAAIQAYDAAISLQPEFTRAYLDRGVALAEIKQFKSAMESYAQALALDPNCVEAHCCLGKAFAARHQLPFALLSFDRAIALAPNDATLYLNRADALSSLGLHEAALRDINKVKTMEPEGTGLFGLNLDIKLRTCDLMDIQAEFAKLPARLDANEPIEPYLALLFTSSPALQKKTATTWTKNRYPLTALDKPTWQKLRRNRIHIAYFSADFRDHPVSRLIAELFELHDRERFNITAFSFGPPGESELQSRIISAVDRFIDIRHLDDDQAIKMARELKVDIAVNLGGFTTDARTELFSGRCAPIQVNYLGYPGTMGASFMDYLIVDRLTVPEELRCNYSEEIVYLPCYQANDRKRAISQIKFSRTNLGLPIDGMVYCCFNQVLKYNSRMFDIWMNILKQVDDSVLFLQANHPVQIKNLRSEARNRGIDADRLVFGAQLPYPEYLARYQVADLFLDTLPFNAAATASDALWAGLPVLTCTGEAYAGRMATSLLHAIELPELITSSLDEYQTLAIELGKNPTRLQAIRERLAVNRTTTRLFDTPRFARSIEAAYSVMYERWLANLLPAHINISS
jgi:predicted O-linked N-acetylglucosamine transferase (SPINDLY family)